MIKFVKQMNKDRRNNRMSYSEIVTLNISQNSLENTCANAFNKIAGFQQKDACVCKQLYKTRTPLYVFSSQFCEIFQNTFFMEHLRRAAASVKTLRWLRLISVFLFFL